MRLVAGAVEADDVQRQPVDETARRIGLGEFLANVGAADDAHVALERLVHPGLDHRQGVVHEIAPDLVARIGEAVRLAAAGGEEKEPRGADAVAAEDHEVGLLPLPDAGHPVDIDGAGGASVPRLDLRRPGHSG